MAIPIGTTARQIAFIGRWMLATVMVVGMLVWWRPGYPTWGTMSASLLVVFALWLLWRTVCGDHSIPGHPIYMVLAVPAAILTVHFAVAGLSPTPPAAYAVSGAIMASLLFHMALLAAGIMLTQSFLPRAASHAVVLSLCGASIMGGSAAAMVWGHAPQVQDSLTLLGFAGVAVWLSPLWGLSAEGAKIFVPAGEPAVRPDPLRRRDVRMACVGVAVIATAVFATRSPAASLWACAVVGLVLVLAGIVFPAGRMATLAAGGALTTVAALFWTGETIILPRQYHAGLFGLGEQAFKTVSAGDSGLAVLLYTVGPVGLGWLVWGSAWCAIWLMANARRGCAGDQGRAVVWTSATVLASCALLAGGGVFIPSVTLAIALTWGMLPSMLGRAPTRRHGAMLVVPVVVLMLMLGVARNPGLAIWSAAAFGLGDKFLHGVTGLVLAASMAWLIGSRRWWLGLIAIAISALAGGAGELIQLVATSWRDAELSDWAAHAVGSSIAVVPYLLCMGSRLCESADVSAEQAGAYDTHAYDRR